MRSNKSPIAKHSRKGFTLIELMIVVSIIGILAAEAIPKFAELFRKAQEGATKGNLTALRSALTIYVAENEGFVPQITMMSADNVIYGGDLYSVKRDLTQILVPKYISEMPTVKLGKYHANKSYIYYPEYDLIGEGYISDNEPVIAMREFGFADSAWASVWPPSIMGGEWGYTTASGGSFWVNCNHTDTKNKIISNW